MFVEKTSCFHKRFYGNSKLKLLFVVFALLVCNTAGGLASGLAGGLAFAAAAGLSALVQVTSFDGLNSAHVSYLAFHYIVRNWIGVNII